MLHRRASEWYEHNALPAAAIRHALAAQDFERTAGLLELQTSMMRAGSQEALWKGWVQALPAELDAAEARLQNAERWLQPAAASPEPSPAPADEADPALGRGAHGQRQGMVVVNQEEFRSLPGTISIARAC